MCGIAGILSPDPKDLCRLDAMTDALARRGPDARGVWRGDGVGLGHRRLSIIDLSARGTQPMANEDGSLILTANGEIYNFRELTQRLKAQGHRFRSDSDCETLLHLYEEHGEGLLDHVNGMFAFALWDDRRRRLLAAVDRFGKKPLYYAVQGERLILASQLHALLGFPWLDRVVDPNAIDRYLAFRVVPAPRTIFQGVRKLEPGHLLVWEGGRLTERPYWQPRRREDMGAYGPEQVEAFRALLADAVQLRQQSDVPLGIYLSGGVDSAAVAGLMSRTPGDTVVSYTVGFDYAHNEHPRASRLAAHLGMEYNPVTITAADFDLLPEIAFHLDEPFGDLLALPSWQLARRAKEKLTVVLTGDGADEILHGYLHQRLMTLRERWGWMLGRSHVPPVLAGLVGGMPVALLDRMFDYPDRFGAPEKEKLVRSLHNSGAFGSFYEGVTACVSAWDKGGLCTPEFLRSVTAEPLAEELQRAIGVGGGEGFGFLSRLSMLDLKYWISFSALFRLDKLNMAHAVETRSPFLDYRVVEMALNLPDEARRGVRNKEILRAVIDGLYPPPLREKGKQAFYTPMVEAYRERFLGWCGEMLNPVAVARRGIFHPSRVETLLDLARQGSMLANRQLTTLAMLEQWFRVFVDTPAPPMGIHGHD